MLYKNPQSVEHFAGSVCEREMMLHILNNFVAEFRAFE